MAALTSLSIFSAACTNTSNAAGARCTEYLACLSTAAPGELPAALQLYGQDGSCTAALGSALCELSCEQALGQLKRRPGLDGCTDNPYGDLGATDGLMTADMSFDKTALELWDFGTKAVFYTGAMRDPELTGVDPITGTWRCLRDDTNPSAPVEIMRMFEPNDLPDQSINLGLLRNDPDAEI
jgi:hypothetical protein